jgi:hypothetical protein
LYLAVLLQVQGFRPHQEQVRRRNFQLGTLTLESE